MRVYRNFCNKGFTLVELLVVIAIIAILFAVVLVAINPAQRFKDSRNSRRLADVKSIVEAATTYTADRRGAQLPDVPDYQCVGSKPATVVSDSSPIPRAHWKLDSPDQTVDSSGNNFSATITGFTNVSAKLSEGIQNQDPLGGASVANSIGNPTDALTLEGWMKLNQKIEPGSFDHNQALFDKGNYRLQLNSDSGKLEFEIKEDDILGNADAISGISGINSFVQFQDTLYMGAVTSLNEGALFKQVNSVWNIDSGYPSGLGGIKTLEVYNAKLYSGHIRKPPYTDPASVYTFNGAIWEDTNLNGVAGSADVLSMARYRGKLYAGLGATGGASVWVYDGSSWQPSEQFSSSEAIGVFDLVVYNGNLYAGTGRGIGTGDARVYEFNGNTWGTAPVLSFGKDAVYSLAEYGKLLYIGLGGSNSGDGQIWAWPGTGIATNTQPAVLYKSKALSLGEFGGQLFAGWSGSFLTDGQIRHWNASTSTWDLDFFTSTEEVPFLYYYRGKLYSGTRGGGVTFAYAINGHVVLESKKIRWIPNTWYHIAGVYDGAGQQMKLFINGAIDVSQTGGVFSSITPNTNPLYLGIGYGNDALSGVIDDFAVHHSVLSADTIASHAGCYNLGQYLAPEYMGSLPIDPSSEVTDGTDTGYFISKDAGGVITITAPLTETSSSIPEIIKASR